MCCFSRPVKEVSSTNIFARSDDHNRQFIVYSMSIVSKTDVAMILPLPVKLPAAEHDIKFINLKDCPEFFDRMAAGFYHPNRRQLTELSGKPAPASHSILEVAQVGDFEASFVPTMKDFSRLDERFRIPADVWKQIPGYDDYGFAVFKLKPGSARIHPMAFSFPRRNNSGLFFPTVHIHDGQVHKEADFDHNLYCQRNDDDLSLLEWEESHGHARSFMPIEKTKILIDPDQHCYRKNLKGLLANRDTWLGAPAVTPHANKS